VLNAKNHEREAEIVAMAGQKGAVTISTNMAGRGTDIVLGPGVAEKGGLHIVGTERHEARRIDNQLAGRSGRQGDPGSSRFFLSFEDEIMRLFIPEWIGGFLQRHTIPEGEAIEHSMVTKAISRAQKKVEERNFEIRKDLLEFDEVMDQQRKVIYSQRQKVLLGENLKDMILDMMDERIVAAVETYCGARRDDWDLAGLTAWAREKFGLEITETDLTGKSLQQTEELVYDKALARYTQKEKDLGEEPMRHLEKFLLLRSIDSKWKDHLYRMDQLRSGIYLRSYAQVEPIIAYKQEGSHNFGETLDAIQEEVTDLIFKVRHEERAEERLARVWRVEELIHREFAGIARQQKAALAASEAAGEEAPQPFVRKKPKVGRNAPCPCGSGKKYKHCCWDKDHARIGA
jgi:preprotein translocase subunit SecA